MVDGWLCIYLHPNKSGCATLCIGEGTRCCEEIVQEDIVVIDNKSLWCLLAGMYMNDL